MSKPKKDLPPEARRLRKARRHIGYTRKELAYQSRTPESTIRRWENGEHTPREGERLRAVCEVLRVTPGWVLDGDSGGAPTADDEENTA